MKIELGVENFKDWIATERMKVKNIRDPVGFD